MAKPTIKKIWAQDTANRSSFTQDQIASGINYQGSVVSNQLNGAIYETQSNLDAVQRGGTAWNAGKTYETGDVVIVWVNLNGTDFTLSLLCTGTGVITAPLPLTAPTSPATSAYSVNYDYAVVRWSITATSVASVVDFIQNDWKLFGSQMGNLIAQNTTITNSLAVSGATTLSGTATLNSTLSVKGNTTLSGTNNTSTTPSVTDNSTKIATTAFVKNFYVSNYKGLLPGSNYGLATVVIDLAKASDPANCVSWEDDAKSMSLTQRKSFFGHYPCLMSSGIESTRLNPSNYAQSSTGGSATITSIGTDVMVKFPKRGIKWQNDCQKIRISFTDDPSSDYFNYYAFVRHNDGTIKNAAYVGAYKAYCTNSNMYSVSGQYPTVNTTIGNFRKYAQARGTGYGQMNWFIRQYLQAMYVFIHANLNSQTHIGYGRHSGGSVCTTGGSNSWGMDSEYITSANKTSGTTNIKCLGIEDLWGNCWEWVDGCVTRNYNVLVGTQNFNDTGFGYFNAGIQCYAGYGASYISSVAGTDLAGFYPTMCDNNQNQYFCDCFWQGSNCVAWSGGGWDDGFGDGVFALAVNTAASSAGSYGGARLVYV